MPPTTPERLKADAGWSPSARLVFRKVDGRLLLHQLWTHISGAEEWRVVPTEE